MKTPQTAFPLDSTPSNAAGKVNPGKGFRLLKEGEPLMEGDSFKSTHAKLWLDFRARDKTFRGDRQFAHTVPWRRRNTAGKVEGAEKGKSPWRPIETVPKDGTPVDLWSESDGRLTNYEYVLWSEDNEFFQPIVSGVCCVRDATHWMPIPGKPAA